MLDADGALDATVGAWCERGSDTLRLNWIEFQRYVGKAEAAFDAGDFEKSALCCQMAVASAHFWHPGRFTHLPLERLVRLLGERLMPSAGGPTIAGRPARSPERILHAASYATAIGGHARLIWRWIEQDAQRTHSVALTHQFHPVPRPLEDVVARTGGKLHRLNRDASSVMALALRLLRLGLKHDLVVVHSHNFDVAPLIAFGPPRFPVPVMLVDHIDHQFWPGAGVADLVVSLRQSGMDLCRERRRVPSRRSALVPTPLPSSGGGTDRAVARASLGLRPSEILLLTVARAVKFHPVGAVAYADPLLPLLQKHPNVILAAVGPSRSTILSAPSSVDSTRIRCPGELDDVSPYYSAADIYLDSFPFISNTSLLEAGMRGVPLLTRAQFPHTCRILGADLPGLTGKLIECRSVVELRRWLTLLVEQPDLRHAIGSATRAQILEKHGTPELTRCIEAAYRLCLANSQRRSPQDCSPMAEPDVVDSLVPHIFGRDCLNMKIEERRDLIDEISLRQMPAFRRLPRWLDMHRRGGFRIRNGARSLVHLVPERMACRVRSMQLGRDDSAKHP